MEALGINLGYLIVQILNFFVMYLVLKKYVYTPVLNLLEERRERIAQGLEDARVAEEARANAEEEAQAILSEAQSKAGEIVREATERAETMAADIQEEARQEAAEAKEAALEEARQERDRMLSDLRGQVAALAMAATQKLIGEALDEQRQHILIQEFFSGVQRGEVVVLEGASLGEAASAEVTSALPLTGEEQETIKEDILGRIGQPATVSFRVDPSILGGLVIRVGDKVLDGSVSGQLEDMRQQLR